MSEAVVQPANRFTRIFKWLMLYCVLVWVWGLALTMAWPWQKGGDWLPAFPIAATCTTDTLCVIPYGELAKVRADGKLQALTPPVDSGETTYQQFTLKWQNKDGRIETTASVWNFQIAVRYHIDNEQPVLDQYREISSTLFLYALGGALFSLVGLYLRQLRK